MSNTNFNDIDLSKLSKKELCNLKKEINSKIAKINKEKEEELNCRKNYKMKQYTPTYTLNKSALIELVQDYFKNNTEPLSIEKYNELAKSCNVRDRVNYPELYSCPKCGCFTLDLYTTDDAICYIECECGFNLPQKYNGWCVSDTWENFHKWLIKNKYIDVNSKFIE